MSSRTLRYLASIHDVMPSTLSQTAAIFSRLQDAGLGPVTLLVVPGTGWTPCSLRSLQKLVDSGAELAGHGWSHEVRHIRGIKHRLHSALISRNAAEHLSLSRLEAIERMQRCHDWFARHDLPSPSLYVPPAWAMGAVSRPQLDGLPFDRFETLTGVYDSRRQRLVRLPMLGYEADTAFRAMAVRSWNALNRGGRRVFARPIRLGIHPQDFSLKLADDLNALLQGTGQGMSYTELTV